MKTEFNLSEKRIAPKDNSVTRFRPFYDEEDVKEFIRLLKEEIKKRDLKEYMGLCYSVKDIDNGKGIEFGKWIDKLAGEKLR